MSGAPARRKTSSLNASLLSEAPILPASYCFDGPLSLSSARSPDMGRWSIRLLSNPPCCMTGPVTFCLAYKLSTVSTTVLHKRFIAIACESCSQSSDAMCCLLLWLRRSQGSFSASAFRDGLLVYRHPLAEPLPFSRTASFFERHHLTYRVTIHEEDVTDAISRPDSYLWHDQSTMNIGGLHKPLIRIWNVLRVRVGVS